jgi:hypothetical protein
MSYELLQTSQSAIDASRLRSEAERCYRLAQGVAGVELSDELEAIGQAFEREAELLESRAYRGAGAPYPQLPSLAVIEALLDEP